MADEDVAGAESSTATGVVEAEPVEAELEQSPIEKLTDIERNEWLKTGKVPEPKKAEKSAAPKAPEAKVTEPKPEAAPESGTGKTSEGEAKERARANAESRKKQLGAEIQDLLRQRAQLRAELQQQVPQGAQRPAPPPVPASTAPPGIERPVRPKLDQYESYEDYETALDQYEENLADWKAASRIEAERAQYHRQQQELQIRQRNEEIKRNWETRVAEAKKRHEDFDDIVMGGDVPLNPIMDGFILDSEIGPELVYHLASHPAEADRISKLSPYATARELGKIELALSQGIRATPTTTQITGAKPPPTELAGKNVAPADEVAAAVASGDFRRYYATANAREIKRS